MRIKHVRTLIALLSAWALLRNPLAGSGQRLGKAYQGCVLRKLGCSSLPEGSSIAQWGELGKLIIPSLDGAGCIFQCY